MTLYPGSGQAPHMTIVLDQRLAASGTPGRLRHAAARQATPQASIRANGCRARFRSARRGGRADLCLPPAGYKEPPLSLAAERRPIRDFATRRRLLVYFALAYAAAWLAFEALLPETVPESLLAKARSLDALARPLAMQFAGPALPLLDAQTSLSRFLATVVMGLALNALYLWLGRLLPLVVAHWALDVLLLGLLPLIVVLSRA
jgi:hypothetical protein